MSDLAGKHILLGVGGSVAAFKAASLASELTKLGAEVRVILTAGGERFVTAETFRDLTEQPVAASLWDAEMDHIELAGWADLLVIAPATANLLARMALGLADDLLTTVALAADTAVLVAPAMETHMWEHAATISNVATLRKRGVAFVGPEAGRLASGSSGSGRMAEPAKIVTAIAAQFAQSGGPRSDMDGLRLVVTAGPTQEPIDPVRFVSNRSSGKMGYELALAAHRRGAAVTLISGPVDQSLVASLPDGIHRVDVQTAREMKQAVLAATSPSDVVIMAAAVADFRPANPPNQKIKKSRGFTSVELEPTDDILLALRETSPRVLRVGFAAETEDVVKHAAEKLQHKGLAMVVANDVGDNGGGVFGSDSNQITIIRRDRDPETLARMSKREAADRILDALAEILSGRENLAEEAE